MYSTQIETNNGRYVESKVYKEVVLDIPIETVKGSATLTHIGAYKRIKFLFEGHEYVTQAMGIAVTHDIDGCRAINYTELEFDKDVDSMWLNYTGFKAAGFAGYWMSVK